MYARAKPQLQEYCDKHGSDTTIAARLRSTVGEYHWKQAHKCSHRFLKKMKAKIILKKQQMSTQRPVAGTCLDGIQTDTPKDPSDEVSANQMVPKLGSDANERELRLNAISSIQNAAIVLAAKSPPLAQRPVKKPFTEQEKKKRGKFLIFTKTLKR